MTGCSTPWKPLSERFATTEPLPAQHQPAAGVNLLSAEGFYTYDGDLAYALTENAFVLQFSGIRLDRGTLAFPVHNIAGCGRISLPSHSYTTLWLPEPRIEVSVTDAERGILKWCEEHHLPVIDCATYIGTIRRQ
jgi:hypothetical protein